MKKKLAGTTAQLFPDDNGWVVRRGDDRVRAASVAEVMALLPKNLKVEAWLPSRLLVSERLLLPQAPREDLLAMAQIQLEKLLPYAADEFVFDLEEIEETSEGAQLLAVAASYQALVQWAAPIRDANAGPTALGIFAVQLARGVPSAGISLVIWAEEGDVFVLLSRSGRLLWMDSLSVPLNLTESDQEFAVTELSRALLGAELAGACSGKIDRVHCALPGWEKVAQQTLGNEVVISGGVTPDFQTSGNWMPSQWVQEAVKQRKQAAWTERIQLGAIAYMGCLALGFGWLALQKSKLGKVDREIQELQPKVDISKSRQGRWKAMEPAVDPSRYLIEVLHQVSKGIEAADIRITEFRMNDREFSFQAEAATYAQATEYVARLKKESGLAAFKMDAPNPKILPNNERAQFQVTGKTQAATVAKK
jgi:hypothetical protein